MEITFSDRQKAKRIIEDLRRDYTQTKIAKLMGLNESSISMARSMWMQPGRSHYGCPKAAIARILEYGKLLGMRR
ncbi:MAG: hypothetical protein WCD70_15105 [Alphaproteobacteria bacterium]